MHTWLLVDPVCFIIGLKTVHDIGFLEWGYVTIVSVIIVKWRVSCFFRAIVFFFYFKSTDCAIDRCSIWQPCNAGIKVLEVYINSLWFFYIRRGVLYYFSSIGNIKKESSSPTCYMVLQSQITWSWSVRGVNMSPLTHSTHPPSSALLHSLPPPPSLRKTSSKLPRTVA